MFFRFFYYIFLELLVRLDFFCQTHHLHLLVQVFQEIGTKALMDEDI